MQLFIFKPSNQWSYCGGAYILIACDWDEVVQKFQDGDHILHKTEEDVGDGSYDHWVLVASYDVDNSLDTALVLDDYNWA